MSADNSLYSVNYKEGQSVMSHTAKFASHMKCTCLPYNQENYAERYSRLVVQLNSNVFVVIFLFSVFLFLWSCTYSWPAYQMQIMFTVVTPRSTVVRDVHREQCTVPHEQVIKAFKLNSQYFNAICIQCTIYANKKAFIFVYCPFSFFSTALLHCGLMKCTC